MLARMNVSGMDSKPLIVNLPDILFYLIPTTHRDKK